MRPTEEEIKEMLSRVHSEIDKTNDRIKVWRKRAELNQKEMELDIAVLGALMVDMEELFEKLKVWEETA